MNRFVLLLGLALTFSLPSIIHAQASDRLNGEAQAALDRGFAAAERSDWTQALAEFTEAQKLAPTNPIILFNLGLAHSNLGNDIAAIVWFHAYIAAEPTAANAPKVRLTIASLEANAKAKEKDIFDAAIKAANKLKSDLNASDLGRVVGDLAEYAGEAGYSQGFDAIANIEPTLRQDAADIYWYEYAKTQAQDGDVDGARKSLGKVSDISSFMVLRFQYSENGQKPPPPPRQDAEDAFWDDRAGGAYGNEKVDIRYDPWNVDFQSLCKIVSLIRDAKMQKQALWRIKDFLGAYNQWLGASSSKIWVSFAQNDVTPSPQLDKTLQGVAPNRIPRELASTASFHYGRVLLRIHALDKRLSNHVGHGSEGGEVSLCGQTL